MVAFCISTLAPEFCMTTGMPLMLANEPALMLLAPVTTLVAEFSAVVDVGQDDLELVAAQTPDFAPAADDAFEAAGDLLQQLVASRVTQRVVDMLEPVEIEHHQCATALRCLVGREDAVEALVHAVAVGKAG